MVELSSTPATRLATAANRGQRHWLLRPRPPAELPVIIGFGVGLATVFSWLGACHWRLELFCNFRWQYCWLLAICAAILTVLPRRHRPRWWQYAILLAFALANFAAVLPEWLPSTATAGTPVAGDESLRLRVFSLNLHHRNQRFQEVVDAILAADAEVVLLMEVDDAWLAGLAALEQHYPYRILAPQDDSFGIALFSRLPLTGRAEVSVADAVPYIDTRLSLGKKKIRLLGIHPLPPLNRDYALARNAQLVETAALLAGERGEAILVGDLNCTPWSPHFRRLLARTGLRDSRRGFGLQASWPTQFPAPCRIPIDHLLTSAGLTVTARSLGPKVGSDHLPLIAEIVARR